MIPAPTGTLTEIPEIQGFVTAQHEWPQTQPPQAQLIHQAGLLTISALSSKEGDPETRVICMSWRAEVSHSTAPVKQNPEPSTPSVLMARCLYDRGWVGRGEGYLPGVGIAWGCLRFHRTVLPYPSQYVHFVDKTQNPITRGAIPPRKQHVCFST